MSDYRKLQHSEWECKYHVVFIPKYRRKVLYGSLRRHLGEVFRRLARQKESEIEEGHLMPDHVHMLISIPPKYAVSQVVGFIKGKSAIHIARQWGEHRRNLLESLKRQKVIQADKDEGLGLGVTGTPSFFINGRYISGAQPYDAFKEAVDRELEG